MHQEHDAPGGGAADVDVDDVAAFDMNTIVNALDRSTGRARRSRRSQHSQHSTHSDRDAEEPQGLDHEEGRAESSHPGSPERLSRMSSLKLSLPGGFEPAEEVVVPLSVA